MAAHTARTAQISGLTAQSMHIANLFDSNAASQDPYAVLEQQLGPFSKTPTLAPPQPVVVVISGPSGTRGQRG